MNQIYWLAQDDPGKIDQYLRMPLYEYWTVLDNKLSNFERELQKSKKRKK